MSAFKENDTHYRRQKHYSTENLKQYHRELWRIQFCF